MRAVGIPAFHGQEDVNGEAASDAEAQKPEPDPDCERCEGSGLDPDAYFVNHDTGTWTHTPCSECLPEDDEEADRG